MKRPFTQCKKLMGLVVFGVKVEQCFSLLRPEFDPNVDWLYVEACSDTWVFSVYSGVLSHH